MVGVKLIYSRIVVLLCMLRLSQSAWLRCYKGSLEDYVITPLTEPLPPSFMSCMNPDFPTIVYTFGYRGRVKGPATTAMLFAYISTKKRNVLLLDWEDDSQSGLLGLSLSYVLYAVPSAKKIGKQLGDALVNLSDAGINMTNIHLVGHSLGAHIMGYAGKQTRARGYTVARITGLDPARALFEGSLNVYSGLDKTCAKFVDAIHSDPGGYGTSTSLATVDIWPNFREEGTPQPGCPEGEFEVFSKEELCSHDRSWHFYVEAIASPTSFPAAAALDHETWLANQGETNQTIYLGELINTRAQGNFYLTTNPNSPYGKGQEGLIPTVNQTRIERSSVITQLLNYFR